MSAAFLQLFYGLVGTAFGELALTKFFTGHYESPTLPLDEALLKILISIWAQENRRLVADEFAAATVQNWRTFDQLRQAFLAAAGGDGINWV